MGMQSGKESGEGIWLEVCKLGFCDREVEVLCHPFENSKCEFEWLRFLIWDTFCGSIKHRY